MRRHTFLLAFVLTLLTLAIFASHASAQVPTDNRRTLIFDSVSQPNCSGVPFETWLYTNGTCAVPGTLPWVSQVRVTSAGVITNVPRAQVQRLTTTAECSPNAVPCLRIQDVALGNGNVTVAFVSDTGVVGAASAAVPFSPTQIPPTAPTTLRLGPVVP